MSVAGAYYRKYNICISQALLAKNLTKYIYKLSYIHTITTVYIIRFGLYSFSISRLSFHFEQYFVNIFWYVHTLVSAENNDCSMTGQEYRRT